MVQAAKMDAELPSTVEAIRDGWQFTSQGGAVVSGLLAGVAAQLLSYFRDPGTYDRRSTSQGGKNAVLALCYAALFLNIGSTISAFIILDRFGALGLAFARTNLTPVSALAGTEVQILNHFGPGTRWRFILWHWTICFYSGTICLAVLLLTFIWLQEVHWIGIVMSVICAVAVVPCWLVLLK